jgi:hypothetical protein
VGVNVHTTWKVRAIARKKLSIGQELESERESVKLRRDICLKKNASSNWHPKNNSQVS